MDRGGSAPMVTTDRDVPVDAALAETPPFARDATDVVAALGSDASSGLTAGEVSSAARTSTGRTRSRARSRRRSGRWRSVSSVTR